MAYTVFALKWRPQDFDSIVGQGHIVATLKSALEKGRLAHAYLFAGPRGVGKTSTARILAKALNCKEGPTANPCQKCPSCVEISQGRSLDVIEIDGASNRGIDEIRTLRENVKFAPTQGKFKIYIIDEVHMLTTEAFNALLKTLEEPPEFVKFIFATTQAQKVIPTVLSRCQRMDFRRIPLVEMIAQLERIAKVEKVDVSKEVLFAVAKSSDGSMRDAESVLDQLAAFSKDKISFKDVISLLGLVEQDALFDITEKIIKKDPKGALSLFNDLVDDGKDISLFLSNLIEHFRNLMIAKVSRGDQRLIDLPQDICERLLKQSDAMTLDEIFSAFNIMVNTQEMCKRLESLRIPLEISLVKLAQDRKAAVPLPPSPAAQKYAAPARPAAPAVIEKPPHQPLKPKEAPVKDYDRGSGAQAASADVSLESIKQSWKDIVGSLGSIKMSVATYLNEGELMAVQGNTLTVAFPRNYNFHKESLEKKDNRDIVEKRISEVLKADVRINFVLSDNVAKHKEEADNDQFLKSALDMFGGRVIKEG